MNIDQKISPLIREKMKNEIEKASGNEVFFRGIPNKEGIVEEVEVLARGNKGSVPAILKAMRKGEVIIHNHPSGYLYPSDADIEVASIYSSRMDGASYIVNNNVDDIYVIVELLIEKNEKIDVAPYFEKTGLLAQTFSEFEYRDEQLEMAKHIETGLNSERKVIVEAGTGTGKTLAYLIPSIEWAIKNRKRVVISTNTINLQEQLLNKDIPIAKKVIQGDFKYTLVKGRGNYLCNRKFYNIASGEVIDFTDFSISQKDQFKALMKWGGKTQAGDKAELPFEVDSGVWEYFQSETDICAGNKCPYKNECFFLKSREDKKRADILITNHHMYFADLAIRKEIGFDNEYSILPDYGAVVFDEAHNIEKVARDYFSYEVSRYSFTKIMNQILTVEGKKKNSGILEAALGYLKNRDYKEKEKIEKFLKADMKEAHTALFKRGREYFAKLIDIFSKGEAGSIAIRLKKEGFMGASYYKALTELKDEFVFEYSAYMNKMRPVLKAFKDMDDKDGIVNDFVKYVERIDSFFDSFRFITDMSDEEFIYWVEISGKRTNSKLVATPLRIDGELQETLYDNLKQIVFTSATIAIGENFEYFKESIGIEEETLDKVIHSPFDYKKQMRVNIPTDIPEPTSRDFTDGIIEFLKQMILKNNGKTFVLFTSYSALNYTYYTLRDELQRKGLELFIHGTAPRTQLVEGYKRGRNPVLFGTDSFWEGVDVKGDQLSSVIIVKLPFKVPSDPVTEAIIENLTAQGKNAFIEYQIPESVIKFKQGVGRLIRSKEDRGEVTILDTRMINKRYGKYFMDAIPTPNIKVMTKNEILKGII